ncbi:MAG: hypothetical protein ACXVEE_17400 [Polyangiales bacterium]
MRIVFACGVLCVSGCATSLQGGAQAVLDEGAVSEEAKVSTAAGLGDGRGALLLAGRGSIGVDAHTGKPRGSAVVGYEWIAYGDDFETVRHGTHFGIFCGGRFGEHDAGLVFAEFGHAWVLARSGPGDNSSDFTITALSLAPMIGMSFRGKDEQQKTDMIFGLGLGIRSDSFSMWKFRL